MRKAFVANSALYVGIWTAFALFFFSEDWTHRWFSSEMAPVLPLLSSWAVQGYTWALLAPIVLWLGRRFPFAESRRAVHLAAPAGLSVVCALVAAFVVSALAPRPGVSRVEILRDLSLYQFVSSPTGFHQDIMAYWMVFGLQFTSIYYGKYRERERHAFQLKIDEAALRAELATAELSSLRRHIQPELV